LKKICFAAVNGNHVTKIITQPIDSHKVAALLWLILNEQNVTAYEKPGNRNSVPNWIGSFIGGIRSYHGHLLGRCSPFRSFATPGH